MRRYILILIVPIILLPSFASAAYFDPLPDVDDTLAELQELCDLFAGINLAPAAPGLDAPQLDELLASTVWRSTFTPELDVEHLDDRRTRSLLTTGHPWPARPPNTDSDNDCDDAATDQGRTWEPHDS